MSEHILQYRGEPLSISTYQHTKMYKPEIMIKHRRYAFTLRELEILSLLGQYGGQKIVAKLLGVSRDNVNWHIDCARKRNSLGTSPRETTALTVDAEKLGLLYPLTLAGIRNVVEQLEENNQVPVAVLKNPRYDMDEDDDPWSFLHGPKRR